MIFWHTEIIKEKDFKILLLHLHDYKTPLRFLTFTVGYLKGGGGGLFGSKTKTSRSRMTHRKINNIDIIQSKGKLFCSTRCKKMLIMSINLKLAKIEIKVLLFYIDRVTHFS